jgi:NADP-dependent 3-hydroxy acid dehydrogenase YdfG
MYRINLRAPYLLTRTMLPLLRKQKGQVVFINSSAVHFPRGTVGQYSASKSGLRAFSDSFREEVNRGGIRVLSLFVGRTATSMQKRIHETEGKAYQPDRLIQPADVAKIVTCTLTLPRTVEVTDIMLRPMGKPT